MTDTPHFILSQGEAFIYLAGQNAQILDTLADMEARLMALSQAEQSALDSLKAKIDVFGTGAQETQRVLAAEIARLQGLLTTAQADDTADEAMIVQLQTSVDNLQAAAQKHEADVVGAFADAADDFDKFGSAS